MMRKLAACFILVSIALGHQAFAQQPWPTKPIRLVVGFAPGGNTDIVARVTAARMQEILGQPVVVENRSGVGGVIATEFVAKAPPDGYTLLMQSTGPHTISPSLLSKIAYDPVADLTPVSNVAVNALVLLVNPSLPVNSVKELTDHARRHPGKLNFGSSGIGSTTHLSGEILKSMAGVNMVHVAFRGGSQAIVALLAGETQFMFANLSDALPQMKSGKLRALGVTSPKRQVHAPELPTLAESGLPGFDVAPWNGIVAPGKTPPEIVNLLAATIQRITREPAFIAKMLEIGSAPVGDTPEQFRATIAFELQRWARVVKESGAKAD